MASYSRALGGQARITPARQINIPPTNSSSTRRLAAQATRNPLLARGTTAGWLANRSIAVRRGEAAADGCGGGVRAAGSSPGSSAGLVGGAVAGMACHSSLQRVQRTERPGASRSSRTS